MSSFVAEDQVRLGLSRCFGLAVSGMSHRLFRAGITVAILALAVAFLAHMLAFSVLERETQGRASSELRASRVLGEIVSRLGSADGARTVITGLAGDDAHRLHEYRAWSQVPDDEFVRARDAARAFVQFDAYLQGTAPAPRAALFGDQGAGEASAALAEPGQLAHFLSQLQSFGLSVPLGSPERLERFVISERKVLEQVVQHIQAGHLAAVAELARRFSRSGGQLLESPLPGLLAAAGEAGFDTSAWSLPELTAFALRLRDRARLEQAILSGSTRAEIARELGVPESEITLSSVLGYVAGGQSHASWLRAVLARAEVKGLDAQSLSVLARDFVRGQRIEHAAGAETPTPSAWLGISARNLWLVLLSFLVCGVGVANAMLMSVGERFAEIATMKCLGALDGFVMTLFLFEAVIQGLIGGAIGLVLGALLALLRGAVEYGTLLGSARGAAGQVAFVLGIALVLGIVLAALAAVGPSWVAARLSPMEAMRVD